MRKVLALFVFLIAAGAWASSNGVRVLGFDFVAPIVYNAATDAPNQSGLIVFEQSTQSFVGRDVSGNWVPLSASTSSAASAESSYAAATQANSFIALANNFVILDKGDWMLSGLVDYNCGSPCDVDYSVMLSGWYSATGTGTTSAPQPLSYQGVAVLAGKATDVRFGANLPAGEVTDQVLPPIKIRVPNDNTSIYLVPYANISNNYAHSSVKAYIYAERVK